MCVHCVHVPLRWWINSKRCSWWRRAILEPCTTDWWIRLGFEWDWPWDYIGDHGDELLTIYGEFQLVMVVPPWLDGFFSIFFVEMDDDCGYPTIPGSPHMLCYLDHWGTLPAFFFLDNYEPPVVQWDSCLWGIVSCSHGTTWVFVDQETAGFETAYSTSLLKHQIYILLKYHALVGSRFSLKNNRDFTHKLLNLNIGRTPLNKMVQVSREQDAVRVHFFHSFFKTVVTVKAQATNQDVFMIKITCIRYCLKRCPGAYSTL